MHSAALTRVRLITLGVAVSALALAGCNKKSAADEAASSTTTSTTTNDVATAPAAPPPAADNTDTVAGVKYASYTGDANAGMTVFKTVCTTCHSIDAGVNKIGPSLHGVVGRKAGQIPGFVYSTANKSSGITWTPEKLFQYLENPQRVVPGTKMTFAGFPTDPQKRADVIAYLKQNS